MGDWIVTKISGYYYTVSSTNWIDFGEAVIKCPLPHCQNTKMPKSLLPIQLLTGKFGIASLGIYPHILQAEEDIWVRVCSVVYRVQLPLLPKIPSQKHLFSSHVWIPLKYQQFCLFVFTFWIAKLLQLTFLKSSP